jgi:citrate lyase subunit alpha/citrate CoA-transferase
MIEQAGVTASFSVGGTTSYIVNMLNKGLLRKILDVQDFERDAIDSIGSNPNHLEVSAGDYANPYNSGCIVNKLDTVILGATEIDLDFNVNVTTGSNGLIMGGSGGHSDSAAGAKLTIIVANLLRGRLSTVVDKVLTVTTPGESVDVLVTERGIAVNPRRKDLLEKMLSAGLPVKDIKDLKKEAEKLAGVPGKIKTSDRVVAVVEYRDGTMIDVVHQVID